LEIPRVLHVPVSGTEGLRPHSTNDNPVTLEIIRVIGVLGMTIKYVHLDTTISISEKNRNLLK
jgi:hypothetical protein